MHMGYIYTLSPIAFCATQMCFKTFLKIASIRVKRLMALVIAVSSCLERIQFRSFGLHDTRWALNTLADLTGLRCLKQDNVHFEIGKNMIKVEVETRRSIEVN